MAIVGKMGQFGPVTDVADFPVTAQTKTKWVNIQQLVTDATQYDFIVKKNTGDTGLIRLAGADFTFEQGGPSERYSIKPYEPSEIVGYVRLRTAGSVTFQYYEPGVKDY